MEANLSVKRAVHIVGASLSLGIIFDLLFFGKLPGVSFPVYMLLVLGVLLLAMHSFKGRIPKATPFVAVPLLFFSGMVFVRAGALITVLNVLVSFYLLGLLIGLAFRPRLRGYAFLDYLKPLYELPIEFVSKAGETLAETAKHRKLLGRYTLTPQVIRGILITVPVALLFVILFASADLVFRKYVTGLFDFQINDELLPRLFIVFSVSFFFVGILSYLARKTSQHTPEAHADSQPELRGWGMVETTILFSSLNLLFLSFIALQLTYMFGGEQNIAGQGFTYAEYARKGFFELIAVAVLSLVLITGAEKLLLKKNQTHSPLFKVLSGLLIAQVLIVMASAFSRLLLYEDAYGFTVSRFYAHSFLIWLAAVFCILLYKIFWNRRESVFAFLSFGSVLLLLMGINLVNVDAFVARQNIERYHATGKLDAEYLVGLSDDAIPEIATLLGADDSNLRGNLAGALYERYQENLDRDSHWQSNNLSRNIALKTLETHKSLLEANKDKRIEAGYDTALKRAKADCQNRQQFSWDQNVNCRTVHLSDTSRNSVSRTFYFKAKGSSYWSYRITLDRSGRVLYDDK